MAISYSFFLGANTPEGFYSHYPSLIDLDTAREVMIIKAPPGGGKSGFMKRVAAKLGEAGAETELLYCSSDPNSLDGVVFPALGTAIVDGTAPHVVEPTYPDAVDRYLHLGAFVDRAGLLPHADEVRDAIRAYKEPYADAYRCIKGAAAAEESALRLLASPESRQRTLRRAHWIGAREFGRRKGAARGREKLRFLSGITPVGWVTQEQTPAALCARLYELEDDAGMTRCFLTQLREQALSAGQDVITCFDPLFPERPEHLLIPGLSLGFVHGPVENPYRRVRLSAYADSTVRGSVRGRVRLLRRLKSELLREGIAHLAKAKALHDELERLYNPYVDFDRLYALADETAERLLEELS